MQERLLSNCRLFHKGAFHFNVILLESKMYALKILFLFLQVPWSNQAVSLSVVVEKQCLVSNEYFPASLLHICGFAVKV